jgi:poly(3-hydroxyoctanoate) depolymerase
MSLHASHGLMHRTFATALLGTLGAAAGFLACASESDIATRSRAADASNQRDASRDAADGVEAVFDAASDAVLVSGASSEASTQDSGLPASRCQKNEQRVQCTHENRVLTIDGRFREVQWQIPIGPAPASGFPVAIMFHGSLFGTSAMWDASSTQPYGAYYQAELVQTLLDRGFAVLTPEARISGSTYWDTNVPPYSFAWTTAPDHKLMLVLLQELETGGFGSIDTNRMFAAGISSGGYMTSRMAEAYPGKFRALAIQSGSWATCSGAVCTLPSSLPTSHPPTLFLHGGLDLTVPVSTARRYHQRLQNLGIPTSFVADEAKGHEWIPAAPAAVIAHFTANL